MTQSPVLTASHIRKSFGNVHALKDASLTMQPGEVTALIGDNGAGKSTLVRCICGIHNPDAGQVSINGEPVRFSNPEQAREAGIETVHQNLALVEDLTVWQNLFLSRELTSGFGPLRLMNRRAMSKEATTMVSTLAINVPSVKSRVRRLSGGQRQAVALLMATMPPIDFLILDEHTAALDPKTALKVLTLSAKIVEENHLTTMMITHNMKDAIKYGNRLIMMHEGHIIYDVSGEEKKNLHVSDLLAKFQIASGGEFANDRRILS